jgi:hypothetical protein
MRSFALKFGIVWFATSLGWTSANADTCTQLKQGCLASITCTRPYCQNVVCNFRWEACMKSGWWGGRRTSRPAEKR